MKMGRWTGVALCGLLVMNLGLAADSVEARSLEDILKDKGAITAEEYAEANNGRLLEYRPGQGVTATSVDGLSRLHLGGYGQLLYRYTKSDDPVKENVSDFNSRRFKFGVDGTLLSRDFSYKFVGDVANGFKTEDLFVTYKISAPLSVQAGQFVPPQSRQELTSSGRQLFPERSLANETFNLGRDQGFQIAGSLAGNLVGYSVGLFNGNGPNISHPDSNHLVAGRIDINPLGPYKLDEAGWPSDKLLLNIGASFSRERVSAIDVGVKFDKDNDVLDVALDLDKLTDATFATAYGQDLSWQLWTANTHASWQGATLAGEYYHLAADPQLGADWDADGYYLQGSYQLLPKTVELAARYSAIKSTDGGAVVRFDKAEKQLGVNYYVAGHNLKLQADLTMVADKLAANKDDAIARVQAQFYY